MCVFCVKGEVWFCCTKSWKFKYMNESFLYLQNMPRLPPFGGPLFGQCFNLVRISRCSIYRRQHQNIFHWQRMTHLFLILMQLLLYPHRRRQTPIGNLE